MAKALRVYLGQNVFDVLGSAYAPTIEATMVGMILWLICYWMYRRRIFIHI